MRRFLLLSLLVSAALHLAAPDLDAQIPPAVTLQNNQARLQFTTDVNDLIPGTSLELVSIQRLDGVLTPIAMTNRAGSWKVRFMLERPEPTGPGECGGGGGIDLEWFDVSMDGSVARWNPTGPDPLGNLDFLSFDSLTVFNAGGNNVQLRATWSGQVTLQGETSGFVVTSEWAMVTGRPFADTTIQVDLTNPAPLGFYVSHVVHPDIGVSAFGTPKDALVVPWVSGSLVTNPTDPALPFKPELALGQNFFPVTVTGYYDGTANSNCFYLATTDADEYWKELWLDVQGQANNRRVTFAVRNVPEDVYESKSYVMPYAVRVGALQGDWWSVAAAYRDFLQNEVPWYQGPVGSPAHPMPLAAKKLVGEVLFQPSYVGDHMDMLTRQMMDLTRIMGPHVNAIWYGGYAPDSFSHWWWSGGYLPGRPSLVGAVLEGQKQFDHVIAPYINGTMGSDFLDPALIDPPPPTQVLLDLQDAFLIDEDLQEIYICSPNGSPRSGSLCSGSPWWQDFFVDHVSEIGEFTGMNGVYLDFFLTFICYADDHGPEFIGDTRGHQPGGGSYMYVNRMKQLQDIKARLGAAFAVTMEWVIGRFTEEVHVMHVDPAANILSAENHPGTSTPKPMDNAVTIPLFRAIYDNVKLSRITIENPDLAGRRAWIEATNVFTFGILPGITRPQPELTPVFSERFAYSDFYNYLSSLSFPAVEGPIAAEMPADEEPPFPGSSGGDIGFVPQQLAFNAPYFRYLSRTTRTLCEYDFLRWHTGTIQRIPQHVIHDVPGFTGIPGVELDPNPPQTNSPTYLEENLVTGMFQAPDDLPNVDANSLAFVVTNPWVDPTQQATFDIDFTVRPSQYPGWSATDTYTIVQYDAEGNVTPVGGNFQGPWASSAAVEPGEIIWWVLRQQ